MTTILEVLEKGTGFLEKKGVEDARLNVQLLLAEALETTRMDLYLRFEEPLAEEVLAQLREQLRQRSKGVPLQHLLGHVEFCKHRFRSDARALIPRPETEELVSLVLQLDLPGNPAILDLACGSGVIGLSLAKALEKKGGCQLTLADLSLEALQLAQENASALQIEADFVKSDLFSELSGPFDLIVANLPYVPESDRASLAPELAFDPEMALFSGPDGFDHLRRFAAEVGPFLAEGGHVALEVGHDQGPATGQLLKEAGLPQVHLKKDLTGLARFVFATK